MFYNLKWLELLEQTSNVEWPKSEHEEFVNDLRKLKIEANTLSLKAEKKDEPKLEWFRQALANLEKRIGENEKGEWNKEVDKITKAQLSDLKLKLQRYQETWDSTGFQELLADIGREKQNNVLESATRDMVDKLKWVPLIWSLVSSLAKGAGV